MNPGDLVTQKLIGISLGDVTGIGPEVTLKALARQDLRETNFVLIGNCGRAQALAAQLKLDLDLRPCPATGSVRKHVAAAPAGILVRNPLAEVLPEDMLPGAAPAANAAVAWLQHGAELCLRGEMDALVTAPVNKEAIIRAGHSFTGQTEFLAGLAGTERSVMMLLGQDDRGRWLRVALATTHVSLRQVPHQLTQAKIELAIDLAAQACRDLGLDRARIAVCGLNPHAGEGGHLGKEELVIVGPAVQTARRRGLDVVGPLSADALFYYAFRGDYDAVVAMYHDQGLAPLKIVAFEQGINWTLGLPFIRTSPDHGTAYDIVGTGQANPSSMLGAVRLATQLAQRRR